MDEGLRQRKIAAAVEVASQYASDPGTSAVYLTGSLMAGLGNARSDVDIFVISSGERPTAPPQHKHDNTRVDVEIRPPGWLESLARAGSTYTATTESLAELQRRPVSSDTVVRLLCSSAVKESAEYTAAVARLRENVPALRRLIMGEYVIRITNALEDVDGALVDGDLAMADLRSRELALDALQAFLVGCGDMYLGAKWLPAKLRRTPVVGNRADEWLGICGIGPSLERDIVSAVERRIELAQVLVVAASLNGWDEPRAYEWPYWPTGASGARRGRMWCPLRVSDAILLLGFDGGAERQFKASDGLLKLWGALHGDESVTRMIGENERCALFLARLAEVGAVRDLPVDVASPR